MSEQRCQRLDERGARCRREAKVERSTHDQFETDRWYLTLLCRRCSMGAAPHTELTDAPFDVDLSRRTLGGNQDE